MKFEKAFRLTRPFAFIFAIVAISATAKAADSTTVTFSQVNQNVFQSSCVSCHSGSGSPAGVDLSTFDGVSGQVVPGSPQQSKIYQEISDGKMPPTGALPQDQIQQVSDWITAGAKND